jgi:chemotaxis protein CheC
MSKNLEMMNELHLDVFREIGNIGSSSAATALSKIVDKKVTLSLPKVSILEFNEITTILGGEETQVAGILQPIQGDLTGNIMFLLGLRQAHELAALLLSQMLNQSHYTYELGIFNEMELSALREIGNIMISSYLSAISALTNLKIIPKVPEMSLDMAAAILSVLTIEFGKTGDRVLYISGEFLQDNIKVGGDFFLVPDMSSYDILLSALGVM